MFTLLLGFVLACSGAAADGPPLSIGVTVESVTIAPPTVAIGVGATQAFTATPKDISNLPITGKTITFATNNPAVATVNSVGLMTATGPGTATITATADTKTAQANVTVSIPVATVALTPATPSVIVGSFQQFTATPKDAGGATLSGRVVTFTSSNPAFATVNLGTGLATAVAPGVVTITATCEGQFNTATMTVTAAGALGTTANPTALPAASGQLKNIAAYTALNVPAMPAGASYNDPVTGVKIWKVTSPTVPSAGPYGYHDYSEGPSQISREYNGKHTFWIHNSGPGGLPIFVDFNRATGLTNYRSAPSGTLMVSFAKNPATPSIAYLVLGSFPNTVIRRYDVATNSFADVAPFPAAFPGYGWFAQDMTDTKFVAISNNSPNDVLAWDRGTNTLQIKTFAGLDEPYLEKNGRYIMANTSLTSVSIWDLQTNSVSTLTAPGNSSFAHVGAARGYFIVTDPNSGGVNTPMWAVDPSATRANFTFNNLGGYYPDSHHSGQWVQSDAELGGDLKKQWFLRESYDFSFAGIVGSGGVKEGIALLTLDGSQYRIVAHHYSVKPPVASGAVFGYYSTPRTTISIDGKLIMFDSNMNNSARVEVFLAEVPIR